MALSAAPFIATTTSRSCCSALPVDRSFRNTPHPCRPSLRLCRGDVRVTLDGEEKELSAGSWVFMDANLPHAVYAKTDVVMLLTMLTGARAEVGFALGRCAPSSAHLAADTPRTRFRSCRAFHGCENG